MYSQPLFDRMLLLCRRQEKQVLAKPRPHPEPLANQIAPGEGLSFYPDMQALIPHLTFQLSRRARCATARRMLLGGSRNQHDGWGIPRQLFPDALPTG
jgi:hypothetical protein